MISSDVTQFSATPAAFSDEPFQGALEGRMQQVEPVKPANRIHSMRLHIACLLGANWPMQPVDKGFQPTDPANGARITQPQGMM